MESERRSEMKRNLLIILAAVFCAACVNGGHSGKLHFQQNGFSIAPLEEPAKDNTYQAVMMYLSVSDQFAPNVNVQIKPFAGAITDYVKQTKQILDQGNLKLIHENVSGKSVYVIECTGSYRDVSLHLYSRSVLSPGRVYVATATATENQWKNYADKLKSCVDSFELDKGK